MGEISHFRQLANIYSKDVDIDSAVAEYSQFSSLVNETQEIKNKLDNATVQELLEFLKSNHLNSAYPNVVILYRILGTISVSSAGAERSFSRLKLIKNDLRSTMTEDRLSGIALISIERDKAESIDFEAVITRFSNMKKKREINL